MQPNEHGDAEAETGVPSMAPAPPTSSAPPEQLVSILLAVMDGIVAVDSTQRITIFNPAAEKMFGYSSAAVLGQPIEFLLPHRFRAAHGEHIRKFGATGMTSRKMGALGTISGLRANGEEFPMEASIAQIEVGGQKLFTAILRDRTEQQAADAAVRASDERYRDLVDSANDLIQSVSPEGRLLYVNRAWHETLGYHEVDIAQLNLMDVIHPEGHARWQELMERVLAGDSLDLVQMTLVTKTGFRVDVEGNISCKFEAGKPVSTRAIFRNVTERRHAEERLRESERFLQDTLNALTAHIAVLDENGSIITVNAAWRCFAAANLPDGSEQAGTQSAFLAACDTGANYLEVCDRAEGVEAAPAREMAAGIREVMAGRREEFVLEYGCHSPQQKRWFQVRVSRFPGEGPVRVVVAHEDITQRTLAEAQVRQLARAVEQSPVSILITDEQGRIEYVNPKFTAHTGYSFEDVLGQNPRLLKSGFTPLSTYQSLWQTIRAGQEWQGEFINRKKNGELFSELATISALYDSARNITHFIAVKEDIGARQQAEAELNRFFTLSLDMLCISGVDGMFKRLNPAFMDTLGFTEAELLARPFLDWIHPDDKARTEALFADSSADQVVVNFENRYRTKDGSWKWLQWKSVTIGEEGLMYAAARDVTQSKAAEAALLGLRDELEDRVQRRTAELERINLQLKQREAEQQ